MNEGEGEDETKELETERSSRAEGIIRRHASLEVYGKHADSIEDELRAWSDLLSESLDGPGKKRSFLSEWRESIGSWFRSRKRKRR